MKNQLLDAVSRRRVIGCLAVLGSAGSMPAVRAAGADHAHHHDPDHADHLAQLAVTAAAQPQSREAAYAAPSVTMLDQYGRQCVFSKAMDDGRPVIMNFVFTSCTTICPVMTQVFMQVQEKLVGELGKLHMVSVSIDPEFDTPARLLAYSKQSRAGPQWDFYTGSLEASVAVQKAFDAYRGEKMNHLPLTLLRGPRRGTWTRFDGFASPDRITDAYRARIA
jgi:protein SCO1/2